MGNIYQIRVFNVMADSIYRGSDASYSAMIVVNHTDNNVNRIVNAHEVYSLHPYPSRMLSTHQEFLSLNNMTLINVRSADFCLNIYNDFENYCNRVINTLLSIIYKDIISINLLYKPKKEVNERKMTLKHCKEFQCKTRRMAWRKFFLTINC